MDLKAPFPATCASCGGFLSGKSQICPSCGAVLPIEAALQDLRYKAWRRLDTVMQSVRRQPLYWTAWALAAVPFFVLPPLLAIFLGLTAKDHAMKSSMLLVLAAANVILSIYFWMTAADILFGHLAVVKDWLLPALPRPGVIAI